LTLSERELHDDVSDALDELHKANRWFLYALSKLVAYRNSQNVALSEIRRAAKYHVSVWTLMGPSGR
jgi:hypothetical protein